MITACDFEHTDGVRQDDMLGIRNQTIADIRKVVLGIRFPNDQRPDLAPEVAYLLSISDDPLAHLIAFRERLMARPRREMDSRTMVQRSTAQVVGRFRPHRYRQRSNNWDETITVEARLSRSGGGSKSRLHLSPSKLFLAGEATECSASRIVGSSFERNWRIRSLATSHVNYLTFLSHSSRRWISRRDWEREECRVMSGGGGETTISIGQLIASNSKCDAQSTKFQLFLPSSTLSHHRRRWEEWFASLRSAEFFRRRQFQNPFLSSLSLSSPLSPPASYLNILIDSVKLVGGHAEAVVGSLLSSVGNQVRLLPLPLPLPLSLPLPEKSLTPAWWTVTSNPSINLSPLSLLSTLLISTPLAPLPPFSNSSPRLPSPGFHRSPLNNWFSPSSFPLFSPHSLISPPSRQLLVPIQHVRLSSTWTPSSNYRSSHPIELSLDYVQGSPTHPLSPFARLSSLQRNRSTSSFRSDLDFKFVCQGAPSNQCSWNDGMVLARSRIVHNKFPRGNGWY